MSVWRVRLAVEYSKGFVKCIAKVALPKLYLTNYCKYVLITRKLSSMFVEAILKIMKISVFCNDAEIYGFILRDN